jgi:uncharacterized protein YodC (DUF2158 family)
MEENLTPFNTGDVVELKSGSPKMTVKDIDFTNVICTFYDEQAKDFKTNVFDMDLLQKSTT